MPHSNKNALLKYFYGELSEDDVRQTQQHLKECPDCRVYMGVLKQTAAALNNLPEERPAGDTFARIMMNIPADQPKTVRARQTASARPFFQIGFALSFILLLIYFLQSKISLLPVWTTLSDLWFIETIGGFGVTMILFFTIGTFITLAMAPILYFDLHKRAWRI